MKTASVFVCWLVMAATCLGQVAATIQGPANSSPGDLVILDATKSTGADDFEWILPNSNKGFLTFENDTKLVFASGQAGSYTFCLAAAGLDSNGKVQISLATHTVVIGKPGPVPDPIDPIEPDEPDVPEPVDPVEPDGPDIPPAPNLTGLALDTYNQVKGLDTTAAEREKLAENFRTVISKANALSSMTVTQIPSELMKLNRESPISTQDAYDRWNPFFVWFQGAMKGRNTKEAAVEGLSFVAEGLEASVPKSSPVKMHGAYKSNKSASQSLMDKLDSLNSRINKIDREVGR